MGCSRVSRWAEAREGRRIKERRSSSWGWSSVLEPLYKVVRRLRNSCRILMRFLELVSFVSFRRIGLGGVVSFAERWGWKRVRFVRFHLKRVFNKRKSQVLCALFRKSVYVTECARLGMPPRLYRRPPLAAYIEGVFLCECVMLG